MRHSQGAVGKKYCVQVFVNTYRVWLRYELFRGRLADNEFLASEESLAGFIKLTRITSCI